MGYSCTAAAKNAVDRIAAYHWAQQVNGPAPSEATANGLADAKGNLIGYFERGRENADGAITGSVYLFTSPPTESGTRYAKRFGSFRVDADGTIVRFPLARVNDVLANSPADVGQRVRKFGFTGSAI